MQTMPVLFISHGAPTFAIEPDKLGPVLTTLGKELPTPKAIVVVSPHWITPTTQVMTSAHPGVMHDFGGFPAVLYTLDYPSDGDVTMANHVMDTLHQAGWEATGDSQRALDHGAWVPLRFLYPEANIPVIQVSMPYRLTAELSYKLGESLAALRQEGVLIIASGSLTHNLYEFRSADASGEAYVREFSDWIKDTLMHKDHDKLLQTLAIAPHAQRAHPTPEHFFPLIVAAGAAGKDASVRYIDGGITHGVLSMDSYVFE